jgi:Uma2 family endonuclease
MLTGMSSLARRIDHDETPVDDQIVRLHGATWADYERILEVRGDHSAPRVCFDRGDLQIMCPSRSHEFIKSVLAGLVEAYAIDRDIEISALGAWTLKDQDLARGVEPDECYVVGDQRAERPHLAIEVVWTSGGLDKLALYRALGVGEVWVWRRGVLEAHVLTEEGYRPSPRSALFPGLDLALLARLVDSESLTQAVRAFRKALPTPS